MQKLNQHQLKLISNFVYYLNNVHLKNNKKESSKNFINAFLLQNCSEQDRINNFSDFVEILLKSTELYDYHFNT